MKLLIAAALLALSSLAPLAVVAADDWELDKFSPQDFIKKATEVKEYALSCDGDTTSGKIYQKDGGRLQVVTFKDGSGVMRYDDGDEEVLYFISEPGKDPVSSSEDAAFEKIKESAPNFLIFSQDMGGSDCHFEEREKTKPQG